VRHIGDTGDAGNLRCRVDRVAFVSNPLHPTSLVIEVIAGFYLAMFVLFGITKWRVSLSRYARNARETHK
jgi:hypothetical protein